MKAGVAFFINGNHGVHRHSLTCWQSFKEVDSAVIVLPLMMIKLNGMSHMGLRGVCHMVCHHVYTIYLSVATQLHRERERGLEKCSDALP